MLLSCVLQRLNPRSLKNEAHLLATDKKLEGAVDVLEVRRAGTNNWTDRRSLPLDIDRNLCIRESQTKAESVSTECIEKMIIMTSNAMSWRDPVDDIVDLTEPRFESFCMANGRSP